MLVVKANENRIVIAGGVLKSDGVVIDAETRKVLKTFEDGSVNFSFLGNQHFISDFGRIVFVAKENGSNNVVVGEVSVDDSQAQVIHSFGR